MAPVEKPGCDRSRINYSLAINKRHPISLHPILQAIARIVVENNKLKLTVALVVENISFERGPEMVQPIHDGCAECYAMHTHDFVAAIFDTRGIIVLNTSAN